MSDSDERDATVASAKVAGALGAAFALIAFGMYGPRIGLSVAVGAAIAVANLLSMRAMIRALLPASDDPASDAPPNEPANVDASDGTAEKDAAEDESPTHRREGRRGGIAWGLFAVVKIFILLGGIWLLLTRGALAPIPLVVGYAVLPLGIALSSLFGSLSPSSKKGRRRR